jgi:hypothetical protein
MGVGNELGLLRPVKIECDKSDARLLIQRFGTVADRGAAHDKDHRVVGVSSLNHLEEAHRVPPGHRLVAEHQKTESMFPTGAARHQRWCSALDCGRLV